MGRISPESACEDNVLVSRSRPNPSDLDGLRIRLSGVWDRKLVCVRFSIHELIDQLSMALAQVARIQVDGLAQPDPSGSTLLAICMLAARRLVAESPYVPLF